MDGRLLINGQRIKTKEKIRSINPADLRTVGEAFIASKEDCQLAVASAKAAFPQWQESTRQERKKILMKSKKILFHRRHEVAQLITEEKGSPLPESLSVEAMSVLEALDYYSSHHQQLLKPLKMKPHMRLFYHKKGSFLFQPLGVNLIISPWNFPFLIPFCDVLSALFSGNTVILKPSSSTPLTGLLVGEIFMEAGLPAGVLNVINCRTSQAEDLTQNPVVQTIMFTGSISTGKKIMELASRNLSNIVLELGGNDPMIVLKDADLDRASRGAVWAAFMNCGQSCGSVERVYVAREIAEEFIHKIISLTQKINIGNPSSAGIDMGPLATSQQLEAVIRHIEDAKQKGAQILFGGEKITSLPGYFLQPTVLSKVNHSMKIMSEETFGPTLPIMTFSTPEEAIDLANETHYGLTASIWTRSKKKLPGWPEKSMPEQ